MLAVMAWRNLWRNRRRTLITLVGIAFGVMIAVTATGIGDASYAKMIDYAARMGSGHVTFQHPDYQELPSLEKTVDGVDHLVEVAQEDPQVVTAAPRIRGAVMLATAHGSYGAGFIAVDPRRESARTLEIIDDITEGEFFASADDGGIILGSKLAENLDVKMGRRVVYTLTDKDGEIVSGLARVSGVVHSGAHSLDSGLCLLPIDSVREVIGYGADEATHVATFVEDNRDSAAVAGRLGTQTSDGAVALTWEQTQPDLAGFISMKVGGTIVLEVIIMLLIGAGIFNSLFVSVMERLREFGVMSAIGFSPRQIIGLVMWESFFMGVCGLFAAALLTAGPYYHLATEGLDAAALAGNDGQGAEVAGVAIEQTIYAGIYPESAVAIAVTVLLATLAAGIYPALKAGHVEPADAVKLV